MLHGKDLINGRRLQRAGFAHPYTLIRAANRAGITTPLAAALAEQETGDGSNIWGHDGVACGPRGGSVSRAGYLHYKSNRRRCGAQGCGPLQLTYPPYQDAADRAGGCWRPLPNMVTGYRDLKHLIAVYNSLNRALAVYNGGPRNPNYSYAAQVRARRRKWQRRLR